MNDLTCSQPSKFGQRLGALVQGERKGVQVCHGAVLERLVMQVISCQPSRLRVKAGSFPSGSAVARVAGSVGVAEGVVVGVGEVDTVSAEDAQPVVAVGSTGEGGGLLVAGDVPVGLGDVVGGVALEVPVGVGIVPGVEGVGEGGAVEMPVSVVVSVAVSVAVGSGDADPEEGASDDGSSVSASSCGSGVVTGPSTGGAADSSSSPPRTVWLLSSATGMAHRCAPLPAGSAS